MKLNIGKAIVHFREKCGMSQTDLANATGIRQPTISLYESDKRMPSDENIERIVNALDITKDDIEIFTLKNSNKIVQAPGRVSRPMHYQNVEFFITDDISISIKAVVRDHSSRYADRYNVISDIVESAIINYIEKHYDEIDEIISKELNQNIDEIEQFMNKIKNRRRF
jgi:transcriptional regulator with XRE-family HTH domain